MAYNQIRPHIIRLSRISRTWEMSLWRSVFLSDTTSWVVLCSDAACHCIGTWSREMLTKCHTWRITYYIRTFRKIKWNLQANVLQKIIPSFARMDAEESQMDIKLHLVYFFFFAYVTWNTNPVLKRSVNMANDRKINACSKRNKEGGK